MKKKFTFLVLMIFASANIYSQNYNISFAASGASTTVGTVKVDNLTQNTSLTLNGNDILHLGPVGINETEYNTNNPMIYPNPMQGKAELSFNAEQEGDVQIIINDITGKEILHIGNKYPKGNHKFQLNGLKQGMYLINIKSETYSHSLKLISQNSNQNETAAIEYLGYENEKSGKLKNSNTTINMPYNNGDRLLFKGTSGNYSNIITDIPTSSKTITFNYTACTDFDNNKYSTVKIGTQIWMAENLKTTHYKNGAAINYPGTNNSEWNDDTTGAYAWYLNNEAIYKNTYGALYNWYAAVNTNNLCPTGWHVPSDAEWSTLTTYLGGGSIAGGKLKATTLWTSPNTGATNSSGFTALPGGSRNDTGQYWYLGQAGHFMSSTVYNSTLIWFMYLSYDGSNSSRSNIMKLEGNSVRCVKD